MRGAARPKLFRRGGETLAAGWTAGSGGALLLREQPRWRGLQEVLMELPTGRPRRAAEARVVGVLTAQWTLGRPAWYAIPQAISRLRWVRLSTRTRRLRSP